MKKFTYSLRKGQLICNLYGINASALAKICESFANSRIFQWAEYDDNDAVVCFKVTDLTETVDTAVDFIETYEKNVKALARLSALAEKYKG